MKRCAKILKFFGHETNLQSQLNDVMPKNVWQCLKLLLEICPEIWSGLREPYFISVYCAESRPRLGSKTHPSVY